MLWSPDRSTLIDSRLNLLNLFRMICSVQNTAYTNVDLNTLHNVTIFISYCLQSHYLFIMLIIIINNVIIFTTYCLNLKVCYFVSYHFSCYLILTYVQYSIEHWIGRHIFDVRRIIKLLPYVASMNIKGLYKRRSQSRYLAVWLAKNIQKGAH